MRKALHRLLPLLALMGQAEAQIYADVETSAGHFTCELNMQDTPRTVANFISLAEGTRRWVDEQNGQLSSADKAQPFYNGLSFHRIVNMEGFKLIQSGSRRGDGTDGPGYEIPDEMNATLPATYRFDQPYRLAMANSGPNTNGSQFFITGSAIEGLEGKHTVFGKVVAGQSVVDIILGSEVDAQNQPLRPVEIEKITIRRIGIEAHNFSVASMKLPVLTTAIYQSEVAPEPEWTQRFVFPQAPRHQLLAFASIDSTTQQWQKLSSRWLCYDSDPLSYFDITHPSDSPVTAFRPVLVRYHADALTPTELKGWTLSLENADGTYLFSFPEVGAMGYLYTPKDSKVSLTGSIHAASLHYEASPHHAIATFELDQKMIMNLHLGFDRRDKSNLHGRCVTRVKHFVVTQPDTDAGFYPGDFTEPGGDRGFTMVPIQ